MVLLTVLKEKMDPNLWKITQGTTSVSIKLVSSSSWNSFRKKAVKFADIIDQRLCSRALGKNC